MTVKLCPKRYHVFRSKYDDKTVYAWEAKHNRYWLLQGNVWSYLYAVGNREQVPECVKRGEYILLPRNNYPRLERDLIEKHK